MEPFLEFEVPFSGLAGVESPSPTPGVTAEAAPVAPSAGRTLAEVLPDVAPKNARAWARFLARRGKIAGAGPDVRYDEAEAGLLREFARLVRKEKMTKSRAYDVLTGASQAPAAAETAPAAITSEKTPETGDAGGQTQVFFKLFVEMEQLRAESEAKSRETQALLDSLGQTRELIRELDEERKKTRARLSRIEAAAKARPEGFWARMRAAWEVLLGQSAVMKALPSGEAETDSAEETNDNVIPFAKAA